MTSGYSVWGLFFFFFSPHSCVCVCADDWLYERSSKVFHIGNPIRMEASVHVGHHMGLRVFMTGCVATLDPDIYSVPRYVFIENG